MSRLIKNSTLYSLGKIIPQLSGFILLPIYTKYLSPIEYGQVQSMQIFGFVLLIFFTLATERSIYRLYHDYIDESEKRKFLGNIVIVILLVSITFLILIFLNRSIFSKIFPSIEFYPFYVIIITSTFFQCFSLAPLALLQVKQKAKVFISVSTTSFILSTSFILYFILVKDEKAIGLLKGQLIGNIIMCFYYIPFTLKHSYFKFDKLIIKSILKFSTPLIPALISAWVLNMSNRIFLDIYISNPEKALEQIGIYSLAFKLSNATTIIMGGLSTAFVPIFYEKASQPNQIRAKQDLVKLNDLYTIISFIICFLVCFFSKEIIPIFFNKSYHSAMNLIPFLVLTAFLTQVSGLFNLMNYQEKKTNSVMIVILVSAIVTILGYIFLIPKYLAIGAAWSLVFGFSLNLILSSIIAKRNYYVPFPFTKYFFLTLLGATIIFIDINFKTLPITISIIIKLFLLALIAVIGYRRIINRLNYLLND